MTIPDEFRAVLLGFADEDRWCFRDDGDYWIAVAEDDADSPGWSVHGPGRDMTVHYDHGWYEQTGDCDYDPESLCRLMRAMLSAAAAMSEALSEPRAEGGQ